MADKKLVRWIKKNQSKGYSPGELKKILSSRNWSETEINEALSEIGTQNQGKEVSNYNTKNKKIVLYMIIPAIIIAGVIIFFLRHNIFVSNIPQRQSTSTVSPNMEDCGASLKCLQVASESCTPSKVTVSSITSILGVTKSKTMHYEVRGLENGKCIFYLKVEKDSLTFSPSVSQKTINSEKASFKNQQGEIGTCQFKTSDLNAMLTRWEIGDFSSGDFNVATCSGSYFGK